MRSIFLPSAPPAALMSSTASSVPLWEELPKAASLPVSEANSPTLMASLLPVWAGLLQPGKTRRTITPVARRNCPQSFFILVSEFRIADAVTFAVHVSLFNHLLAWDQARGRVLNIQPSKEEILPPTAPRLRIRIPFHFQLDIKICAKIFLQNN